MDDVRDTRNEFALAPKSVMDGSSIKGATVATSAVSESAMKSATDKRYKGVMRSFDSQATLLQRQLNAMTLAMLPLSYTVANTCTSCPTL